MDLNLFFIQAEGEYTFFNLLGDSLFGGEKKLESCRFIGEKDCSPMKVYLGFYMDILRSPDKSSMEDIRLVSR